MGRHRSDPLGVARLLLMGLAILALIALIVIGAMALAGSLSAAGESPVPSPRSATAGGAAAAAPSPQGSAPVPTVSIECLADPCPRVFVKDATTGDVLLDREMSQGERARYFQDRLDLVLDDSSTLRVLVNGEPRKPGPAGEQQDFTVTRDPDRRE